MENVDIALIIFGLAGLIAPLELARDFRRNRARTAVAEGIVIDHEQQTTSSSAPGGLHSHRAKTEHAHIVFVVEGQEFTCTSSLGASWRIHQLGQAVEVHYDPNDPSNADIAPGPFTRMLEPALLWGFPLGGAICLTIAAVRFLT